MTYASRIDYIRITTGRQSKVIIRFFFDFTIHFNNYNFFLKDVNTIYGYSVNKNFVCYFSFSA